MAATAQPKKIVAPTVSQINAEFVTQVSSVTSRAFLTSLIPVFSVVTPDVRGERGSCGCGMVAWGWRRWSQSQGPIRGLRG